MKKIITTLALAVVALFATSSIASATFDQSPGTRSTASGTVSFAGNILTATCRMSLAGQITSGTTLEATSGSGSCNVGGLTLNNFPWEQTLLVVDGDLTGEWQIPIDATVEVPLVGDCRYAGVLGGTFDTDGVNTILTIDQSLLTSVRKVSGSVLCTDNPRVSGSLTLAGITVS